jgi:hypothetical protein
MDGHLHPMHDALSELVGASTGHPRTTLETQLLVHAILVVATSFALSEPIICARLGWDRYTPERIEEISTIAGDAVLAMLGLAAHM